MLRVFAIRHKSTASSAYKLSSLSNGIRIASIPSPGHFMTVGAFIDAGSKYETSVSKGFTHILDRMAFKVYFIAYQVHF